MKISSLRSSSVKKNVISLSLYLFYLQCVLHTVHTERKQKSIKTAVMNKQKKKNYMIVVIEQFSSECEQWVELPAQSSSK